LKSIRHFLTRLGEVASHLGAYSIVALYAVLWITFDRASFDWQAVATLPVCFMTLSIQRTDSDASCRDRLLFYGRYGAGLVPTPFISSNFLTVLVGMRLRGLVGMHSRLALVTGSRVSVMSGLLMLAGLMLLGSLVVMLGGFTAMHGCLSMVFGSFL
jgi:hypothetical protein